MAVLHVWRMNYNDFVNHKSFINVRCNVLYESVIEQNITIVVDHFTINRSIYLYFTNKCKT